MASKELQMILDALRSRPDRAYLSIEDQRAEMEAGFTQFQLAADVGCDPVDAGGIPAQ